MGSGEQEILDGLRESVAAIVANDVDKIASFLHDDWIHVSERGVATKEHFLSFLRSGALVHTSFEFVEQPRVQVYGNAAIVTSHVTNTSLFNGQKMDAEEFTTDVLVKTDGEWLGVHSHVTSANREFLEMIAKRKGKGDG